MLPPFDLNLMKTTESHDQRELFLNAEVTRQMAKSRTRAGAQTHGWRPLRSAWTILSEWAAGMSIRLTS